MKLSTAIGITIILALFLLSILINFVVIFKTHFQNAKF